jgi:AcrR family transcriptional regulator
MKDTKEIILKTAYNLFLYNNYEAVTINSIIQATGLTKGGIYYYYASKEEIFKAVVDKYMIENHADTSVEYQSLKELIQYTIDFTKGKITRMVIENKDAQHEIPINYLSLMVTAFRYFPDYAKIGNAFLKTQSDKWEKALKKAVIKNEIRNDIDIPAMVANIMQINSGIVGNMLMGGSMIYALDMFERQYWELYKLIKR